MYCVERMQMPVYPKLESDGSIRQPIITDMAVASATAKRLFPPVVQEALQRSRFSKNCGGRSVTFVFTFVLDKESDPNHLSQTVSYAYPNQFWISVRPKAVQP
jgi:hypothetical protein